MRNLTIGELAVFVRTRDELLADGWAVRDIDHARADAPLRRVHRNRYVPTSLWAELWPESRHRIEVYAATAEMMGGSGVISHVSAAALHQLPFYRHRPRVVEFTVHGALRAASGGGVRRHLDRLEGPDIDTVDGVRCTTLERTVFDIARTQPAEFAISCLDAALRSVSVDGQQWDAASHQAWKVRMGERAGRSPGARGIRQARWLIDLADGRAQLPGESVSRLQLIRMGFSSPELQVPVAGPAGRPYWVDFGLSDVDAWGEFDGKSKYTDEAMRSGRTLEEVLLVEKQREDWIRGVTGRRFARWGDEHIATTGDLRQRLLAFGIRVPR